MWAVTQPESSPRASSVLSLQAPCLPDRSAFPTGRQRAAGGRARAGARGDSSQWGARPCQITGLCFAQVCKAACRGWRPLHAHKHPSQNFLDRPPVISDQSMPGTAAVHGLDFFYESEIDYQQTFCPSPSIKLSGPNSAICTFFFFTCRVFFCCGCFWGTKGDFIYAFIQFIQQIFFPSLPF